MPANGKAPPRKVVPKTDEKGARPPDPADLRFRAEEKVNESEVRFRALSDSVPAIIFMKDVDGRYIHVNRLFEEKFHVLNAEIQGKTDRDIFPKGTGDVFTGNDRLVIDTGQPITVEEEVPHGGGAHSYLVVKSPLRTSTGVIYALCGVATDITERKRAEEKLIYIMKAVESASDAIGISDSTRRHIYQNKALSDLFGYANAEEDISSRFAGKKPAGIIHLKLRETLAGLLPKRPAVEG